MKTFVLAVFFGMFIATIVTAKELKRDLTPQEQAVVAAVVRGYLLDPDSARFGWLQVHYGFDLRSSDEVICGIVNNRNGFGGYAGPAPFMAKFYPMLKDVSVTVGSADTGTYWRNRDYDTNYVLRKCTEEGFVFLNGYGKQIPWDKEMHERFNH